MTLQSRIIRCSAILASALAIASCSEKLENDAGCPILCPDQSGAVQNVTLDAVILDTTIASISGLGTEQGLLIASRGDSLDTRAIIRYDSLPARYQPNASDTTTAAVSLVDSAYLAMRVDTSSLKMTDPVTLEAYDVDTTYTDPAVADTSTAVILQLFRPDRLIGSQVYTKTQLSDTLRFFISNAVVLNKAQTGGRLRIGLRAKSTTSTQIRIYSAEAGAATRLFYRVSADTAIHPFLFTPYSKTPSGAPILAANLADYTVIAKSPAPAPPTTLNTGGLPPRRVYFRFNIPSVIVDSSTVIRAALLLTQIPNRAIDPQDTVFVTAALVLAGKVVTDPARASQILAEIQLEPVRMAVGDSGTRAIELAPAFGFWHNLNAEATPRAIVLRSVFEGISPLEARFFSMEAAAGLRPKLQISYVRHVPLGLP